MTTHTPGAVRAAKSLVYEYGDGNRIADRDTHNSGSVSDLAAIIDRETSAKELLDLARVFVSYLEDDSRSLRRRRNCLEDARAAIAKATKE